MNGLGKKLYLCLDFLVFSVLKGRSEGQRSKTVWAECVLSNVILPARFYTYSSKRVGNAVCGGKGG